VNNKQDFFIFVCSFYYNQFMLFHFLFAQKIPTHSVLLSQAASEWIEEHKQNKQYIV